MAWRRSMLVAGMMAAALAGLTGCSGPEVHYDYDLKAEFAGYHSWDWLAPAKGGPRGGFDNAIMAGRVTRAVEAELAAKGLRRDTGLAPDLLVTYYPVGTVTRAHRVHLGLGLGIGPLGVGVGAPVGNGHREALGSIVLEMQDYKTRAVVWKATAEDVLRDSDSPEEADAAVTTAVRSLLKRFPPGKS